MTSAKRVNPSLADRCAGGIGRGYGGVPVRRSPAVRPGLASADGDPQWLHSLGSAVLRKKRQDQQSLSSISNAKRDALAALVICAPTIRAVRADHPMAPIDRAAVAR